VADWLGMNDNDPSITWEYCQERGMPKKYMIRIAVIEQFRQAGPA
jgi:hypothetical protein